LIEHPLKWGVGTLDFLKELIGKEGKTATTHFTNLFDAFFAGYEKRSEFEEGSTGHRA